MQSKKKLSYFHLECELEKQKLIVKELHKQIDTLHKENEKQYEEFCKVEFKLSENIDAINSMDKVKKELFDLIKAIRKEDAERN